MSGRNSLSSISELANDEEVARFMAFDRRSSAVGQDPRFELFCKWLDTQNASQDNGQNLRSESDLNLSGDEFHDAEKEQSPPECVKEILVAERTKSEMVIPTIKVPVVVREIDAISDQGSTLTDSGSLMNINDPVKLMRRKLHSPKKGRAPEPPKSPVTVHTSDERTAQEPANIHLETII